MTFPMNLDCPLRFSILVCLGLVAACDDEAFVDQVADSGVSDEYDDSDDSKSDVVTPAAVVPKLTWQQASSAVNGRTFYGDRAGRTVFELNFTAQAAGERRWVQARMNIEQQQRSSSDPLMMAGISLSCRRVSDGKANMGIGNTQNVLRGTPLTLRPQLIYVVPSPGNYRCRVSAQGGRPRPTGTFADTRFSIASGSYLRVSNPLHSGARQAYDSSRPPTVLDDGEAVDVATLNWTAPSGVKKFEAHGSVKVTTCTSVGGSDDPNDNKGPLCALAGHEINFAGTKLQASFQVRQLDAAGGVCKMTSVPAGDTLTHVSKDTHHEMIYRSVPITISNAPNCTRKFRIKTYLKQISGASIVVHASGMMSLAVPRP